LRVQDKIILRLSSKFSDTFWQLAELWNWKTFPLILKLCFRKNINWLFSRNTDQKNSNLQNQYFYMLCQRLLKSGKMKERHIWFFKRMNEDNKKFDNFSSQSSNGISMKRTRVTLTFFKKTVQINTIPRKQQKFVIKIYKNIEWLQKTTKLIILSLQNIFLKYNYCLMVSLKGSYTIDYLTLQNK